MRIMLSSALVLAVCVGVSQAQQESPIQQQLDAAISGCIDKPDATTFKTHVETILCINDAMTAIYTKNNWPYMDAVYQLEAALLAPAAQADAHKITQPEFSAAVQTAYLQFQSQMAQKDQERRALFGSTAAAGGTGPSCRATGQPPRPFRCCSTKWQPVSPTRSSSAISDPHKSADKLHHQLHR